MKLTVPSRSVNEAFVRGAVAMFAASLDHACDVLADIKTAVSEAVTNCIVHAYPDTVGLIYITASLYPDGSLTVRIADKGCGIADVAQAREPLFTTAPEKEPEPVIGLADRIPPDYDYTLPVPEADPVTLDYFSDAVLVGDSRMQGLILYCGLSRITNYTYKGLTVDSVFSRPVIEWTEAEDLPEEEKIPEELWENGKVPVLEALKQTEYSKVYIMLGINETGWPEPSFFPEVYSGVIDAIREDNPQCLIYVLSVFPVTKVVEEWHDFVTNEKISLYNRYLHEMAAEKQVFFVDLSPAVADETGVLPPDSGVDGIHLNKEYCMKVLEYLYSHTVPLLPAEEAAAKETAES